MRSDLALLLNQFTGRKEGQWMFKLKTQKFEIEFDLVGLLIILIVI